MANGITSDMLGTIRSVTTAFDVLTGRVDPIIIATIPFHVIILQPVLESKRGKKSARLPLKLEIIKYTQIMNEMEGKVSHEPLT